jgi:hypothetical protein
MGRGRSIRNAGSDASPYRRLSEAMLKCHYCASQNVRWFTPRSYADRAAVLLCMACRRLTIVPPRARPATVQREFREEAA